jgi:hypothetical protein
LAITEDIRYAWENDRSEAKKRLVDKALRMGKKINLDQELDRLSDTLAARFKEPRVWDAIARIANKLCDEGAISGQVAKEIFEQATESSDSAYPPVESQANDAPSTSTESDKPG